MSKKIDIRHLGVVREGQRIYYNIELHKKQLIQLEGKEFEEIIKEKLVKPSSDTHGYYRKGIIGTCLESEKFGGWEESEVHAFFANMFLRTTLVKEIDGKEYSIPYITSTGDLSQKEMNEFLEKVIAWLAQEEIEILPSENYKIAKYRTIKTDNNETTTN